MTGKRHILLIEDNENEIEFFIDALDESDLSFLLSTARSIQQAFIILKNSTADIVFINVNLAMEHNIDFLIKLKMLYGTPVIFYSTIRNGQVQKGSFKNLRYVQLPASTHSMARVLRNLFGAVETIHEPGAIAES